MYCTHGSNSDCTVIEYSYVHLLLTQLEDRELPYRTSMKLTIANVTQEDYDSYKCVAKNSKGEKEAKIALYGKQEWPANTSCSIYNIILFDNVYNSLQYLIMFLGLM